MSMPTRETAVRGTAWTLAERLSVQMMQFITGIVLARLLAPDDYGMVGLLSIFLGVAQLFIDSGFTNALVRKKDKNSTDYSTVFYFNIVVSLLLYGILYLCAPFISRFYNLEDLTPITRIISLTVIINGFCIVQTAKFTSEFNFKAQALASIMSVLGSGTLGILMAYNDYGVWALVWQSVSMAGIRMVSLWIMSDWKPEFVFSLTSFKEMFSFGSRLLVSGFIHTIYTNLYTLSIGKVFNKTDVGLYNRANMYGLLPYEVYCQVVNKVIFPILVEKQDDNKLLVSSYQKMMKLSMFFYVPLMFGVAVLSAPLLEALIGAKWLPCAPLLTVLCLGYAISPLSILNQNLLYVKGRSDITLKLDLIKKPIGIAILFATLPLGIKWMCVGKAVYELVAFAINSIYTKRLLNYGLWKQIRDVLPVLVSAGVMGIIIAFTVSHFNGVWAQLAVGLATGVLSYSLISLIYKNESFMLILKRIKLALKR